MLCGICSEPPTVCNDGSVMLPLRVMTYNILADELSSNLDSRLSRGILEPGDVLEGLPELDPQDWEDTLPGELPEEVWHEVMRLVLDVPDLANFSRVSMGFQKMVYSEDAWRGRVVRVPPSCLEHFAPHLERWLCAWSCAKKLASAEKESAVPALPAFQPHQPPSAEAEDLQLTQEDLQKLDHLRGLRNMGVDLPGNLLQDLENLEQKESKAASVKILSHSHLNRLKKLKGQVSTAARKIVDLDKEWAKFMNSTMDKIKEHAVLYQGCRSDMLESYNEKLQELIQVKQEVGRASQSLMSQPAEDQIVVPEAASIEEQMQRMQEVLIQSSQVGGAIDLTNDMDMEEDEPEDLEESAPLGQTSKKGSPKPQKTFRAATSPSKVAQQHLKPRTQDVREAKAKEKEENKA
eukprot:s1027_g4.t1